MTPQGISAAADRVREAATATPAELRDREAARQAAERRARLDAMAATLPADLTDEDAR